MAYTPTANTKFSGTETLTNLTANSSGTIDLSAATTVTAPTVGSSSDSSTNVATTAFVQAAIAAAELSVKWKNSCLVATTGALTLTARTASTLTVGGTALTIDGVVLANGDRVLVKDTPTGGTSTAGDVGIFTVGGIGSSVVLTRPSDADTSAELQNVMVYVEKGTTNADRLYQQTVDTITTLGTTAQTWTRFAIQMYAAGTGINSSSLSSGTVAIDTAVVPQLGAANTFTANQTIQTSSTGAALLVKSTVPSGSAQLQLDAGSTGGGAIQFYLNAVAKGSIQDNGSNISLNTTTQNVIYGNHSSGIVTVGNSLGALQSGAATPAYTDSSTNIATTAATQLIKRNLTFNSTTPVTTNTTITASSQIPNADVMLCNTSGGAITITLPAASAVNQGTPIRIKDANGSAGTNNITVSRNGTPGTDTIDGAASATISTNYGSLTVVSDGASKFYLV